MLIRYEADLQDHRIIGHTHFPQREEGPWNGFRQFSHSEVSSFWSQVAVFSQILRPKSVFSVFTYQSSSLPLFLRVFLLFIFLFFLLCYYSYFFFSFSNFFIFPLPLPSSFSFSRNEWRQEYSLWRTLGSSGMVFHMLTPNCLPRSEHAPLDTTMLHAVMKMLS